jgi:microcystin-dependent protein
MALESGTYIDDLVSSNPPQSDSLTQAAGHLRLIKSTLLATFPNVTGAISATHTAIDAAATAVAAAQFIPSGAITAFAGASLPSGYLWCDGSAVSRSTYAALFTALGSGAVWGVGNGTTTFDLPNFKDRFLVGRATMGATTDAAIIDSLLTSTTLGATYDGEGAIDTITLTTTELPAHTHTAGSFAASGTTGTVSADHTHTYSGTTSSNGAHTHTYSRPGSSDDVATNPSNVDVWRDSNGDTENTSTDGAHTHTYSGTTSGISANHTHTFNATLSGTSASSGSGTAFTVAILPPCAVVNWIIKT